MIKTLFTFLSMCLLLMGTTQLKAQSGLAFNKYHTKAEVLETLNAFQKSNSTNCKLHTLANSPGGSPVIVLEIGSNLSDVPAIFVGANFEGNVPISTEGALVFAKMLLDSAKYTKNVKWFVMPLPNPDASDEYFSKLKTGEPLNQFSINNDADEATDEDGFDDLNGDGLITQMRIKDLEGTYVVSANDSRIMERASSKKGERGEYKLMSEGIDNDGDGKYNEDGQGGINPGIAFPHLFPHDKKEAGLFSGQTPEVYGILRFIYDRPEIAMVFTLGSSDFCIAPPKGGRKGGANLQSIRIPSRYGRIFGIDTSKSYTMDEVIEMFKERVPAGMEVTPSMVAGMLGLGAAVNPLDDDLAFYTKFSEDYKKYLEAKKINTETLPTPPAKDGSFELWAYYHLGVPSFAMNLFTVPKVKEEKKGNTNELSIDKVEKMSKEEFVALGEEKIDSFLTQNKAPERFKAKGLIEMMNSGRFNPEQLAGMMKKMPKPESEGELSEKDKALLAWSDSHWGGAGFISWTKINHPDFEEVEVGGYVPYLESTPKPELIDSLTKSKLPWLLQLSKNLPDIKIADEKLTDLGAGIYKLDLFIENNAALPYPIGMGQRNGQPAALVVVLDGDVSFLEGTKRVPVGNIGANSIKKISWMIKANKGTTVSAKIESAVFTDDVKQIKIGG